MSARINDLQRRYHASLHGMQSGVAFFLEKAAAGDKQAARQFDPKHTRVGINSAMVDSAALAKLLMGKGLITEEEYWEQLVAEAEAERLRYQKLINDLYGLIVVLT